MAYLSKNSILSAYSQLSQLTSDPSAQGATQITSALRYIFALDEFTKKFGRSCDTSNKEDRDAFISFVGNVVSINKDYYTANFFNAIKDNADYAVGSNFFSVNVVKNSVVNPNTDFNFPKRGNNPLFTVKGGRLIENTVLLSNLKEYLNSPELRNAFAVWLVRFLPIDQKDIFGSIVNNLKDRYSDDLVNQLQIDEQLVLQFVGDSLIENPYSLSVSDFPTSNPKRSLNVDLLNPDALISKVRDSFSHFVHLINTHTNDFSGYIAKFEEFVNSKLSNIFPEYSNIFQIVDIDILHAVIAKLKEADPSLEKVFTTEYSGTQYQAFRTMKYYEMYLDILANSDFRANITQDQQNRIAVTSAAIPTSNQLFVRAMRTKPFLLLAGISGTGKSRIVKQFAYKACPDVAALRKDSTSPGNYCLVEVKPNWHDSTELLGYTSLIGQEHYVVTKFVQFVAKAMLYPEVPFFLCLDEMNLAPVEQYFAEFLSVLESRKVNNGHITSEPLIPASIFTQYENTLKSALFDIKIEKASSYNDANKTTEDAAFYGRENEIYDRLKTDGLRIPENLIVIGTVNMDETTHQFSRKVIDRAMTIEMNIEDGEQPFTSFFEDYEELAYTDTPLSKELFLPRFVSADEALRDRDASVVDLLKAEVPALLGQLNHALNGTPFKIAYRVQNELILYFIALFEDSPEETPENLLTKALDDILMMKVLPRIEGDEDTLKKPLNDLHSYTDRLHLDNSKTKIEEMQERLDRGHFTSFWP